MRFFKLLLESLRDLVLNSCRWITHNKILSFFLMLYFTWWIYLFYILHLFQKNADDYVCYTPLVVFFILSAIIYLAFSIGFLLLVTFSTLKSRYEAALYITQIPILIFLIKAII
jgi:hypothetical protein